MSVLTVAGARRMKALLLESPRNFKRIDTNGPGKPGPGEAVVRVHRVGVCGTDVSGYLGKMPLFSYPRIPGHELGVEVLDIGPGVENVHTSYASRRGRPNCCEWLEVLGVHRDGGLRPAFIIPARKLHVARSLSFE